MKIVIIAGGTPPGYQLFNKIIRDCDYFIAADRGADILFKFGVSPDFLIGDFDSIDAEVLKHFTETQCFLERYPSEKDATDTEIAMKKAFEIGVDELFFLGCTGTRVDHLLGNIGLLLKCMKKSIKAYIIDEHNEISIIDRNITLKGNKNEIFSIQAYCEKVESLSIKGAKYDIRDYDLRLGDGITLSNEFLDSEVEISFSSGALLLIRSKD